MHDQARSQRSITHHVRHALCGALLATLGACVDEPADDEYGEAESEVAIAGPWNPPADVRAASAGQFVHYDPPPPFEHGALVLSSSGTVTVE